ncbi:MAG: CDP-alcohol phosphatidyltransferase family protein [Leptospira sp.]|nr:CDP-alcohol phosphatidyltransferase family protein [Leptospira sp.]
MLAKNYFSVPNLITSSRVLLLPLAIYLLNLRVLNLSILVLFWIFLSDFFDGYLARKWNQTSTFGSILDPIADKLVVLSLLGFLFLKGFCPFWYISIVILRNLSQLTVVPVLIWWKQILFFVKPKFLPKLATALGFLNLAILGILFFREDSKSLENIGLTLLLSISAVLEVQILFSFWPRMIQIYQKKHDTFE